MKTYYLILLMLFLTSVSFSQSFQIELVDESIGASLTNPPEFYTNESNDVGLNQIFMNHNVSDYEAFSPSTGLPEPYSFTFGHFNSVQCNSCNAEQFLSDLNVYSSVVRYASLDIIEGIANNVLSVSLINDNIGVPVGFNNDIVVTNDNGLNQIFQDFNVRTFGLLDDIYGLVCSCAATQLKIELDNYSSVISTANYQNTYFLLSVKKESIENINIFPNPFKDRIRISNSNSVEQYQLFDILGKKLINTNNKNAFETFSETLNSGIYIIKLSDYRGNSISKKLIKN